MQLRKQIANGETNISEAIFNRFFDEQNYAFFVEIAKTELLQQSYENNIAAQIVDFAQQMAKKGEETQTLVLNFPDKKIKTIAVSKLEIFASQQNDALSETEYFFGIVVFLFQKIPQTDFDKKEVSTFLQKIRYKMAINLIPAVRNRGNRKSNIFKAAAANSFIPEEAEQHKKQHQGTFANFAVPWIEGEILRALRKNAMAVHTPEEKISLLSKYRKTIERLSQQFERLPSIQEIATEMRLSLDQVQELATLENITFPVSFDSPVSDKNSPSFGEFIATEDPFFDPFEQERTREMQDFVVQLIQRLPERQQVIVCFQFFEQWQQKEIAGLLELSRETVRTDMKKAMQQMQNLLREKKISFSDFF